MATDTTPSDGFNLAEPGSSNGNDQSTSSPPPDWDNVPFDVACARCGQDLHGLTDPTCPGCSLTFDWADAVPIERLICLRCGYHLYGLQENRCPECGTNFTWDAALAEYHRRRKPLFEYRWREEPIRSFFGTWFRALSPGKFWKTVDIHDPPRVGPLITMTVVVTVLVFLSMVVLDGIDMFAWSVWGGWRVGSRRALPPTIGALPLYIFGAFFSPVLHAALTAIVVWLTASLLSLMLFPESMRLCRVRFAQVLRVWAYALPHIVPVATTATFLVSYAAAFGVGNYGKEVEGFTAVVALVFVTRALRLGYRDYLRMPHSLAVAIASQVIAFLATGVILMTLFSGFGSQVYLDTLRFLNLY